MSTDPRHELPGAGLGLALVTAASFGTSGTFATALTSAGWSSGAAVTARVGIAALVLTVPGLLQLRRHTGRTRLTRRSVGMLAAFGLVAVAACQLAYFHAVERLSVGVALMLEYLGIILVVLWVWLRTRRRPRRLTLAGSAAAIGGLVLVLDLGGAQRLDLAGVAWGLGAAVGLAAFFVLSARTEDALPPITLAWAGTGIGALGLAAAGATGVMPLEARFGDVELGPVSTSWVVPVLGLALVATVLSYCTGIAAARRLGATVASFVGLTEVLFAVLFAWLVLGQLPTLNQLFGGLLILAGVTAVRVDELRRPDVPPPVAVEPVPAEPVTAAG